MNNSKEIQDNGRSWEIDHYDRESVRRGGRLGKANNSGYDGQ